MGTTKLKLYNGALRMLGERKLASLTEDRKPRRVLDETWDAGTIDYCLEKGLWNHAIRTTQASFDPDVSPGFGHAYAFSKPSDFIRTAALCEDEHFYVPHLDYRDEQGYWFSDLSTLYISYVSNDDAYGNDLTLWPQTFIKYVASYLAWSVCKILTQGQTNKDDLETEMMAYLRDAKAKDAIAAPTEIPPSGTWVNSRHARHRERGRRNRLIG